ncbi:RagB/SusD family nutrient uptake outer membrane protein [Pedobacter insulae]|uniref:RagB/SusD family nutrient uptake outer membrane protein n=1 Tax=Pedobacter insulae TaxID=414048 RepID=UPI0015A6AE27|nr:RagB/SusD family nutrient uptake outer membrane protein [Pedobacter insulae]
MDKKPNKALLIPQKLADFQALLDNITMNRVPDLQHIAADDCFVDDGGFSSLDIISQNAYIWSQDTYQNIPIISGWNTPYSQVFYCNIVLDGLEKIKDTETDKVGMGQIHASALFYRAFAFFNLLQVFAAPYGGGNENSLLGVPIRLSADVNEVVPRSNLKESYDLVVKDLERSIELFSTGGSAKSRPSKAAAQALLARVYLAMSNYKMSKQYASIVLASNEKLLDYNLLDSTSTRPLPNPLLAVNDEVIFYATILDLTFTGSSVVCIDSSLTASYGNGDLRKPMFFRKNGKYWSMKGNYSGARQYFNGLATDEMILIQAECLAREGAVEEAMANLNKLLVKRWKKNQFVPLTAINQKDALSKILAERRKELVCRGLRWSDLRRFNLINEDKITMKRNILNKEYQLLPNDKRYVFAIPNDAVILGGLIQNER